MAETMRHRHKFNGGGGDSYEHTDERYERVHSERCSVRGCQKWLHLCFGVDFKTRKSLNRNIVNESPIHTDAPMKVKYRR